MVSVRRRSRRRRVSSPYVGDSSAGAGSLFSSADVLLFSIATVLREAGMSRGDVERSFRRAAKPSREMEKARKDVIASTRMINQATRVLHVWFSDPRYLDESGRPKVLREFGAEPNIHSLIRGAVARGARVAVRNLLRESASVLVTPEGFWSPIGRQVVRVNDERQVHRLIGLVEGLIRTHVINASPVGRRNEGNFDRCAVSFTLPDHLIGELRMRTAEQFAPALENISMWLERGDHRSGRRSSREVGVETFMYVLPVHRSRRSR